MINEYVQYCVFNEFDTRRINLPKDPSNCHLFKNEVQFKIENGVLSIERKGSDIDEFRLGFFTNFTNQVLNSKGLPSLNFKAIISLGDGPENDSTETRLCFARERQSPHVCIPDAHLVKLLHICHDYLPSWDIPFSEKINKACFFGSDTGRKAKDGSIQRIRFCELHKDSDLIDAKITAFVQGPMHPSVYGNPVSIQEQLKYKFIFNINGNTTSWERLIWAMNSNSICIFIKPPSYQNELSWYYHIFDIFRPFPEVDELGAENFLTSLAKNKYLLEDIKNQQKMFGKTLANVNLHARYYSSVLINYHYLYNGLLK
jgi:hypothetical protein